MARKSRSAVLKIMAGLLAFGILAWKGLTRDGGAYEIEVSAAGTRVELIARAAPLSDLRIYSVGADNQKYALFGRTERTVHGFVFRPVLPLPDECHLWLEWQSYSGMVRSAEVKRKPLFTSTSQPVVKLSPTSALPANALKIYLHFSHPMEKGVMLDKVKLTDAAGREIPGAFRETELWSADGQRLTLWLHPGRQKTGVNLNEDEGPVLVEGQGRTLHVAGSWRSAAGTPLGNEVLFPLKVSAADHAVPKMAEWKLKRPAIGTRQALEVSFDEPLDTELLRTTLSVRKAGATDDLSVVTTVDGSGSRWTARPVEVWKAGEYELRADPVLEDLAGNSLTRSFETDATAETSGDGTVQTSLRFSLP